MNILRMIINAVPLALGYCCLATVIVQVGGGVMMWSTGKLSQEKVVRYAAILYGLDIAELPAEKSAAGASAALEDDLSPAQLLARRTNANAILADRKAAMEQEADKIRSLEKELKSERDRRATVRKNFGDYLDKLEGEVVIASLGDVQRTLEELTPRQAKDLILRTLADQGLDKEDDVMRDIVTIVKAMPEGKLKKILGEFKTAEEQEELHRIVMEVRKLATEGQP